MLIQDGLAAHAVPTLREVVATGEPLDHEANEQVPRAWGSSVREGYGQTATTAQVGGLPGPG